MGQCKAKKDRLEKKRKEFCQATEEIKESPDSQITIMIALYLGLEEKIQFLALKLKFEFGLRPLLVTNSPHVK